MLVTQEGNLNLEFSEEDLTLLYVLLSKEEAETKVEIRHSRTHDYKDFLRDRETQVINLLARIRNALGLNEPSGA